MACQFYIVDEFDARWLSAADSKTRMAPAPLGDSAERVRNACGSQGRDSSPRQQPDALPATWLMQSILNMPFYTQMQRLKSKQEEESGKRTHAGAGVSKPINTSMNNIGEIPKRLECFRKPCNVVRLIRLREFWPFLRIVRPEKPAAVDDGAANMNAVSANERVVEYTSDINSVLNGTKQSV
jgi:hypothetical protein